MTDQRIAEIRQLLASNEQAALAMQIVFEVIDHAATRPMHASSIIQNDLAKIVGKS